MGENYYVGLDGGSGSLGWAVTNEKYEIQRSHGKALWGVRLFDAAETADERRGFRTNRRRLDRRNWRLELLQEIFAEEINQVDDGFFLRMKESRYLPEDKRDKAGNCRTENCRISEDCCGFRRKQKTDRTKQKCNIRRNQTTAAGII